MATTVTNVPMISEPFGSSTQNGLARKTIRPMISVPLAEEPESSGQLAMPITYLWITTDDLSTFR